MAAVVIPGHFHIRVGGHILAQQSVFEHHVAAVAVVQIAFQLKNQIWVEASHNTAVDFFAIDHTAFLQAHFRKGIAPGAQIALHPAV